MKVENVGRVIYGDNREGPLAELTWGITGQLIVINLNGEHLWVGWFKKRWFHAV